jgi:hypothetical protein
MSKLIMIHTKSSFEHVYAVRVDDDADSSEIAENLIATGLETSDELCQFWLGEEFLESKDVTEEEVVKAFDENNTYIQHIPREKKLSYIIDLRTNKEEQ